ncbi:bacterial conjugation TrbI-like family protein [Orientia chuto str. Dubai]|uniref:Bacterial conjugation TrbI-like family protein n=1 Tax=Orientia chuto str. Dubai TaxID=1359168 RepID=A0A0F3MHH4_9RICK|nr:TrbI/VirB10 family protein [Candidatus Orientia mediorientalis]KJV55208.1 bacterial conjugation TrbI-like family protein [Orientia chuto str. Dubai]
MEEINNNSNQDQQDQYDHSEDSKVVGPEVHNEFSKVASSAKRSILLTIAIIIITIIVLYFVISNIFINEDSKDETIAVPLPVNVIKPNIDLPGDVTIPELPTIPTLITPELPEIKVPNQAKLINSTNDSSSKLESEQHNKSSENSQLVKPPALPLINQAENNLKESQIPVLNLSSTQTKEKTARLQEKRTSTNTILINKSPPSPSKEEIEQIRNFVDMGELRYLLERGTIIDAVIINAINTDFIGEVIAMVSKDVYSKEGKTVLIPRGSKVFGYPSVLDNAAYGRVMITWSEIQIAGSKYKLNLSAPTIDRLGKIGITGKVNNKNLARIMHAVLVSAVNIGTAFALDKIVSLQNQVANTNDGVTSALIKNVMNINNDSTKSDSQKIIEICSVSRNLITDKSSTIYSTINQKCLEIETSITSSDKQKLPSLINTIVHLSTSATLSTNSSNTQKATSSAINDVVNEIKKIIPSQEFNRTVTLNPGQNIKIYVNKDYLFPAKAVSGVKSIQ